MFSLCWSKQKNFDEKELEEKSWDIVLKKTRECLNSEEFCNIGLPTGPDLPMGKTGQLPRGLHNQGASTFFMGKNCKGKCICEFLHEW